ncbi:MAG: response regulator transcription factor [Bacteroidota bacterium]|nr:response regulator transcription factor [Bacteroidota bacterium]
MIRVFIVDDHPVVAEGIRSLLSPEQTISWQGHALNAADCIEGLKTVAVDVLLLDINLPDKNGVDLCKEVRVNFPGVKVLALSTLNQPSFINKIMNNGGSGYVLKNADKAELMEAIRTVAAGDDYLSEEASRLVKAALHERDGVPYLTRREKEILGLLATGLTTPEIAEKLFVSPWTVDGHRKSIMTKLNVRNTASLIKYAYENGLLE